MDNSQTQHLQNSSKMIGALVVTDKPVVVNSSFGGSSTMLNNGQPTGRDVGLTKSSQQKKLGKNIFCQRSWYR
jgi:hypothetical protein